MDLIIVGAGGMGRELFLYMQEELARNKDIRMKGFLDDNPNALEHYSYPIDIIGSITDYKPRDNERLLLAIMDPALKRKIAETLLAKGALFYSPVHPSAMIGMNTTMGEGCIILPNCIVTNDIQLGDFVFINTNSIVGHDASIGDYTSVNGFVLISGKVSVGSGCMFGIGAKVIPGRHIGNNVTVGAGSVVMRNIPDDTTVIGVPAKPIGSGRGNN